MCLLQIIFVAIKLTPSGISSDIILNLNWGAVFAPSWVLFLIVPLLARGREPATLFLAFLLIWVPFFVVLICITVKLNRQQYYGNGPDIRMALIFLPFWIIEGAVMLGALLFVFFGIHTLRLGLITGIYEHIGKFWTGCGAVLSYSVCPTFSSSLLNFQYFLFLLYLLFMLFNIYYPFPLF